MILFKTIGVITCLFLVSTGYSQSWPELKNLSEKAFKQFDIGIATAYMENAVDKARIQHADNSNQYDSLIVRLSEFYTICMKYDKSTPLLKDLIHKKSLDDQTGYDYIHALTNLGLACIYREQADSAYLLLKQADALITNSFNRKHFLYAENMLALSRVYLGIGKIDSALFCITEAGNIYEAGKDRYLPEYILATSITGRIYQQVGDPQKAKYYLFKASAEIKNALLTYHPYVIESMINMAEYAALIGRFSEAKAGYLTLSIIIPAKLGADNPLLINVYNNQGFLSLRMNKAKDAFMPFNQALRMLGKQGMEQSIYFFITKNNLGLAYLTDKQYNIADSILSAAAQTAKLKWGENHYLYGMVIYNTGLLFASTGRLKEAANDFITAGKIYKAQLINDLTGLSEREKLGTYYMSELFFQILPSFAHLHRIDTDGTIENSMFMEQSFLKGLISSNQQKILTEIRNSNDSALIRQLENWTKNRILLSGSYKDRNQKNITDSLVRETNLIESNMMSSSRSFHRYQSEYGITAKEIGSSLKKDEAAIEFVRYRLFTDTWTDSVFYAALLIEPGSNTPVFIDLCTEQQLKNILSPYYFKNDSFNILNEMYKHPALRKPGKSYASDSLYNLVWKPLEEHLQKRSTVYISATGLLNLISFPALPYHKQLLLSKYKIFRIQHLSSLATHDTSKTAVNSIALWGGINYNLDNSVVVKNMPSKSNTRGIKKCPVKWSPLNFTLQEVQGIKDMFKNNGKNVVLHQDVKATKQSFLNSIVSKPSFLHIATHGFYIKDTTEEASDIPQAWSFNSVKRKEPLLRSGLVFAGANKGACPDSSLNNEAVITSYDIASMNLENVQLVTLSACETALGDIESGEGVFGLQRALKLAGVEKMILTLWPVRDRQTSVFMNMFYKSVLSGSSIRDAFIYTQQKMSNTNTPQYWAGFILIE